MSASCSDGPSSEHPCQEVRAYRSAEEALRLTQQNLLAGTGLLIDVLQAQGAADQARLRNATALVQYNQAQINLLGAIGLLCVENIEPRLPELAGNYLGRKIDAQHSCRRSTPEPSQ
ncbi:TolC family protein [Methylocystis sp. Sn-Cys]|uniref:TolC family protein n=1 Tax=Methylocystis sp. Sn-Cys TaxID=1701263 RepID=UPI001924DB4B|nr:TolC family protein [Methylocystis sp. Sn-Cys]